MENKSRHIDLKSITTAPAMAAEESVNKEGGPIGEIAPSWFVAFEARQSETMKNLTAEVSEVKSNVRELLEDVKVGVEAKQIADSNTHEIRSIQSKLD